MPGFAQPTCTTFDCSSTIQDAAECSLGLFDCSQQIDFASCPRFCGAPCTQTTVAQQTTQAQTTKALTTVAQATSSLTTAGQQTTTGSPVTTAPLCTLQCSYGFSLDSVNCLW